jgi:hypothetical protein
MACATAVSKSFKAPEFTPVQPSLPPPAPTLAPYVEVGWMFPENPSEFCYGMAATCWCQQVPDADHYTFSVTKNGQQVYTDSIEAAGIQYQYAQIPGYFLFPFDSFFNSQNPCSEFSSYTQGQVVVAPADTLVFSYQACDSSGCSGSSPALKIINIGPGNYGTPPAGAPTSAPTGTTTLQVVNPSMVNLTLQFAPVAGAESYEIIDMDEGPTFYIEGVSSTDNPIQITVPESLLQSLGLRVGSSIDLAVQAKNTLGSGPIGTPTKVVLTS